MKKIKFLFLVLLVLIPIWGFAAECDDYGCATCVYENATWKFTYDLKSNGNGSAELTFSYVTKGFDSAAAAPYAPKLSSKTLVAKNFVKEDTDKLFCPAQLHILYTGASGEVFGEPKELSATSKTVSVSLLESESKNNNLSILKENAIVGKSCSYEFAKIQGQGTIKTTITYIDGNLKFEFADGFKLNENSNGYDLTADDFKSSCPKIYGQCGSYGENKYCSVSKNQHFDVLNRDEAQDGYEEQEAGKNGDFNLKEDNAYQNIGSATVNCGSLGLFKDDLNMIFKIIKIVAPILVIVFSVYDFIKAAAGKVEGEMKKAFSKLLKRMIFAIILFFLPTVLNYFLGLAIPGFEGCITG